MDEADVAAIVAVVISLVALSWRVGDYFKAYLHVHLDVEFDVRGFLTAKTTVENRGLSRKKISNALLLVGPERERPLVTMKALGCQVASTNDIAAFQLSNTVSGPEGRCIIPLDFYYSENVDIADESISYRVPIDTTKIPVDVPYSARFFIVGPRRLHRSTHDCFSLRRKRLARIFHQ